ncbi:hypothetical protein PV413_18065 [Streptomyces scabiei]|uniref:hypothetical protein n=1 Tax=Streptomyces scabiei TaxID=1930 RepID=UPI0029BE9981|nr:hypothetical protein [Streptomyces scabiei]MDX3149340.1 hypothetical protein [Streptomyces scabiei]
MTTIDPTTFETRLADGRRMTLTLPPTDAGWAAEGIRTLRPCPLNTLTPPDEEKRLNPGVPLTIKKKK